MWENSNYFSCQEWKKKKKILKYYNIYKDTNRANLVFCN